VNNCVCFEMDIDHELVRANYPCESEMKYRSLIGFGQASFVNEAEEKRMALDIITRHYSEGNAQGAYVYPEQKLANTVIIKVKIESPDGKEVRALNDSWINAVLTERLTYELLSTIRYWLRANLIFRSRLIPVHRAPSGSSHPYSGLRRRVAPDRSCPQISRPRQGLLPLISVPGRRCARS
jgi:hypothetical protein